MFNAFKSLCEEVLRIPPDPEPPPGDHGSVTIFRAAPNYFRYLLALWALGSLAAFMAFAWVGVSIVAAYVSLQNRGQNPEAKLLLLIPVLVLVGLVLYRLFALAILRLNFEKRWYVVTDRSLRVREGVVYVQEMTVTFANIQNISVQQGPLQRMLGIADLRVETAGGGAAAHQKHAAQSMHVAFFRGINNAAEVRELIQQRLRQFRDAGLGDHDDVAEEASMPDDSLVAALREVAAEAGILRKVVENRD